MMNQEPYQSDYNQQVPNQQSPDRPYQSQPPYIPPPSNYRGWFLVVLAISYTFSFLFICIEIAIGSSVPVNTGASTSGSGILSTAAIVLVIVLHGIIIVKGSRNFFTLFGKLHWRGMKTWLKVVLVFVYLCMWIMPGIYLVQAIKHFLRTRRQTLGQAMGGGWVAYKAKTRRAQLMIGIGIALLVTTGTTFVSVSAMSDRANMLAILTPTATVTQTETNVSDVTPTKTQDEVATTVTTATPSPKPTSKPAPTPHPTLVPIQPPLKPTPRPTQPSQLFITFTCASATDYSYGQVCVHTLPGAALTITVTYCSGYSATSESLHGTSYTDGNGNQMWTWTPETKCRGTATADVNASWNGQSVSNSDSFTVQ